MPSICIYFQVHQPSRLRRYSFLEDKKGNLQNLYFDDKLNEKVFNKVTDKCYMRTNKLLLELLHKYKGKFKISYSITGVFLEQCEKYRPDLLETFKELADTGCVDFLSETYFHSISSLFADPSKREFHEQVELHKKELKKITGISPKVFRNTEALFSNDIGRMAEAMGYKGVVSEGIERVLGWRSQNYLYSVKGCKRIKLLMRNYRLSDDVAYRFSARWWSEWPLTADKYASWLKGTPGNVINLFMDYETFGEHQWEDTGIFEFLKHFPGEALKHPELDFKTPSEVVEDYKALGELDVPDVISWADNERDASAWLGNDMQRMAFSLLQELEGPVRHSSNKEYMHIWRLLQNSDHLYYLCTKCLADGDVHKYFSHYQNPYEGFINYMNILRDFKERIEKKG
jgi:alpha-amylase